MNERSAYVCVKFQDITNKVLKMSVQVKTPRGNEFERTEFQCGEKVTSNTGQTAEVKEETVKFQQPRKRRYSQGMKREDWQTMRRKRLKSAPPEKFTLPRFLLGGNISDPLNLNSLYSSEDGRVLNEKTPASSPVPVPAHRGPASVQVMIPTNVTDPLNLNSDDGPDVFKMLQGRKKKRHNKHKKKDEFGSNSFVSPQKDGERKQELMEALKIDIEPEQSLPSPDIPIPEIFSKSKSLSDKIVSPVLPQTSPKCKKRRRAISESSKVETIPLAVRSSFTSDECLSHTTTDNKTCSPQKKPRRSFSNQPKSQGSNKNHPKFIHGNYNRYYGYRNPDLTDNRLTCFKPEWFTGKAVLDIGCNIGHVTLTLARDYRPCKIVGLDIDPNLIGAARKNIRHYMSACKTDTNKFPVSSSLNYGPIAAPPVSKVEMRFPRNVLFMQGNYVLESDEMLGLQKEEYDIILALSVTKWVHFNNGDSGLKRFFKRAYKQLKPGGKMILEPQPWSSYKKKKKLTEDIHQNFLSIKLRPEQFTDYLLSKEVGFKTCEMIDVPYNSSKGFRRAILLFTKSDTRQNSPNYECAQATEVKEVKPEVKEVKPEVKVKPEVSKVKPEVSEVKPEVKEVKPEVKEVKPEVREVKPEVQSSHVADVGPETQDKED